MATPGASSATRVTEGSPRLVAPPGIPRPTSWLPATLAGARRENAVARTLAFDVPGWPGHRAGQHVIVRLRAEDGYTAQRSYSIASAPGVPGTVPDGGASGDRIELTVQRLPDGEVSPYLTDVIEPGDQVEIRGPIGSWFTWSPAAGAGPGGGRAPVQLIAGGSGIVPLMAMIRAIDGTVPGRLLYSARTPNDVIYGEELQRRSSGSRLAVTYLFTRAQGRISAGLVADATWAPELAPEIFACGPSGFVEAAASLLIEAGHHPATIKTERFGPTS